MNHKKIIFFSILNAWLLKAGSALAANYTLLSPLPLQDGQVVSTVNFAQYVRGAYQLAVVGAGVSAVIMIVWGGFDYVLTDKISGKSEGRKKINNALIGLLIVLGSYALLYTLNHNFVTFSPTVLQPL